MHACRVRVAIAEGLRLRGGKVQRRDRSRGDQTGSASLASGSCRGGEATGAFCATRTAAGINKGKDNRSLVKGRELSSWSRRVRFRTAENQATGARTCHCSVSQRRRVSRGTYGSRPRDAWMSDENGRFLSSRVRRAEQGRVRSMCYRLRAACPLIVIWPDTVID